MDLNQGDFYAGFFGLTPYFASTSSSSSSVIFFVGVAAGDAAGVTPCLARILSSSSAVIDGVATGSGTASGSCFFSPVGSGVVAAGANVLGITNDGPGFVTDGETIQSTIPGLVTAFAAAPVTSCSAAGMSPQSITPGWPTDQTASSGS